MRRAFDAPRRAGETRPSGRCGGLVGDAGMVLLEAALAIPLLLMCALAGVGVVRLAVDELAVVGAARDAAIALARGTGQSAVERDVRGRVPRAAVEISRTGGAVTIRITSASSIPLMGSVGVRHEASATSLLEPGR